MQLGCGALEAQRVRGARESAQRRCGGQVALHTPEFTPPGPARSRVRARAPRGRSSPEAKVAPRRSPGAGSRRRRSAGPGRARRARARSRRRARARRRELAPALEVADPVHVHVRERLAEVEGGVADVGDLRVEQPRPRRLHQHVAGLHVAVHQALARFVVAVAQLGDPRAQLRARERLVGERAQPRLDREVVRREGQGEDVLAVEPAHLVVRELGRERRGVVRGRAVHGAQELAQREQRVGRGGAGVELGVEPLGRMNVFHDERARRLVEVERLGQDARLAGNQRGAGSRRSAPRTRSGACRPGTAGSARARGAPASRPRARRRRRRPAAPS